MKSHGSSAGADKANRSWNYSLRPEPPGGVMGNEIAQALGRRDGEHRLLDQRAGQRAPGQRQKSVRLSYSRPRSCEAFERACSQNSGGLLASSAIDYFFDRFMFNWILKTIVGSKNQRELRRIQPVIRQINEIEQTLGELSDEALRGRPPRGSRSFRLSATLMCLRLVLRKSFPRHLRW